MKDWILAVIGSVFIVYILIGGIVFTLLERDYEEQTRLQTKEYKQNWLGKFCYLRAFNSFHKYILI